MFISKLAGAGAGLASQLLIESAGMRAVNNYMARSLKKSTNPIAPSIPLSKPSPVRPNTKKDNKESLGNMGEGLIAGLGLVAGLVGASVNSMSDGAVELSNTNKAEVDAKKLLHPDSPLLFNQVALQNAINGITDSINDNSLITATVFGTLDSNLSTISSTLLAISSTLIEISENYTEQLEATDELPFVDTETFYEELKKSNPSDSAKYEALKREEMHDAVSKLFVGRSQYKDYFTLTRTRNLSASEMASAKLRFSGITHPVALDKVGSVTVAPNPSPDYSFHLKTIAEGSASSKILNDFKMQSQTINDLDGNPISTLSPEQAKAISHASNARHKTDTNSEEFDESMFPSLSLPILPFIASSDIYDPLHSSPTSNPFTHKLL